MSQIQKKHEEWVKLHEQFINDPIRKRFFSLLSMAQSIAPVQYVVTTSGEYLPVYDPATEKRIASIKKMIADHDEKHYSGLFKK